MSCRQQNAWQTGSSPRCSNWLTQTGRHMVGATVSGSLETRITITPCTISHREAGHPVPAPQVVKGLPFSGPMSHQGYQGIYRSPRYILGTGKLGELRRVPLGSPTAGGPRVRCRKEGGAGGNSCDHLRDRGVDPLATGPALPAY